MKNIFTIIGVYILTLIGFSSCGDSFLESDPTVDIPENEYFISEEKLVSSLMAAYQPLMWHDWAFGQYNPLMIMGDIMGEDIYPGGDNPYDNEHWHRMSSFNCTPDFTPNSLWLIFYSGINRSNIVIQNMDNIKGVSEKTKNRVYAEALTLRAYYYHWLWRFWGNVPYYDRNPSTSPYLVDQIPADELYEKILNDLDIALDGNKLPATVIVSETGLITKAVAQMLRANVVLYQNDDTMYPTVLTDMREIINSSQYSLYADFGKLWEDQGEWCSESIFEVNYSDETSARSWDNPLGAGGSVTPQLIGMYSLGGSSDYNGGWGFGPVSKSIYDLYNTDDQRKDGGILNFDKYKIINPSASYTPRYQDTGCFLKKYLPHVNGNANCTGIKELNYRNNYRVYRYAETLLLASELIVRTGGPQAEADNYYNQVRARAFKLEMTDPAFAPYKKIANLDNLLEEYRFEFVGEGHRYWDLVRFGKAEQVLGARGYAPNKKHLPIPRGEIDKAQGTLTQNPY